MIVIVIGRKVPKGWKELPGSIHLGRGLWAFKCAPPVYPTLTSGPDNRPRRPRASMKKGG